MFSKCRFIFTILGVLTYAVDIGTDVCVSFVYFMEGDYYWFVLTLLCVFSATLTVQTFSYSWFKDDQDQGEEHGISRHGVVVLHLLQMGIFTRYGLVLRKGLRAIQPRHHNRDQDRGIVHEVFAHATDVSMLRLFETFLESAPQLILQTYIILKNGKGVSIQYATVLTSLLSIAWATVDYQRCLRRSLHHKKEMAAGLPSTVYLLYKLLTVTSRLLSITLLTLLNYYYAFALAAVWLLGTVWAFVQKTDFCTSKHLEVLYRFVIGLILIFTYFNIKDQNTKTSVIIYYVFQVLQTSVILVLVFFLNPSPAYVLPISITIGSTLSLGVIFLILYYKFLHPQNYGAREADEIDGLDRPKTPRIHKFIHQ
ncbi:XKR9 protein, partial [Amia calva]|nr:XKR9 protein [Amia calva]